MHPKLSCLTDQRLRLALLLTVLAALVVYAVTVWTRPFGVGDGSATSRAIGGCSSEEAPALIRVSLTRLLSLRSHLDRTMADFEPGLRPYEEGLVSPISAWTDAEPVTGGSRPTTALWPAGYEMRWWLKSGDDLVADVFVFVGSRQAHDFLALVRKPLCGSSKRAVSAAPMREAHNLRWRNPLGFAQEDVYLRRGRRIYGVHIVKPRVAGAIGRARRADFDLIDDFACRLSSCR